MVKGMGEFRQRLPDYPGRRVMHFAVVGLCSFLIGLGGMIGMDLWTRLGLAPPFVVGLEPVLPVLGMGVVEVLGYGLIYQVWRCRRRWLQKFHDRAYQHAFHYVMVGVPLVFSMVVHAYFPILVWSPAPSFGSLTWGLAVPLTTFLGVDVAFTVGLRLLGGVACVVLAGVVLGRALQTFGLDYVAVVYLYYPEDSQLQDHEIYSVLRHPVYHSLFLFFFGAVIWQFSVYALLFFCMFTVGMVSHIRFVEEKELVERFGQQYLEYRRQVPAVIVRLRDLRSYFRFLLGQKGP